MSNVGNALAYVQNRSAETSAHDEDMFVSNGIGHHLMWVSP